MILILIVSIYKLIVDRVSLVDPAIRVRNPWRK